MKYCSNCGKSLEDEIKFCPECGSEQMGVTEVSQQTQPPKKKKKRLKYCMLAVAAVFILLIIIGSLSGKSDEDKYVNQFDERAEEYGTGNDCSKLIPVPFYTSQNDIIAWAQSNNKNVFQEDGSVVCYEQDQLNTTGKNVFSEAVDKAKDGVLDGGLNYFLDKLLGDGTAEKSDIAEEGIGSAIKGAVEGYKKSKMLDATIYYFCLLNDNNEMESFMCSEPVNNRETWGTELVKDFGQPFTDEYFMASESYGLCDTWYGFVDDMYVRLQVTVLTDENGCEYWYYYIENIG